MLYPLNAPVLKLALEDHGSYLRMEKGCFTVRDKEGNVKKHPLFESEIGEIPTWNHNKIIIIAMILFGRHLTRHSILSSLTFIREWQSY
jgi:hypothetical protein